MIDVKYIMASRRGNYAHRNARDHFSKKTGCSRRILVGVFLIFLLFTVHATASTITIDNSSSIAGALLNVGAYGTVILQPGTYFEHDIVLTNSTTIRANTSAGGSAGDTIIDAGMAGRIIHTGIHSLTIEDLTLLNGKKREGGAIYSINGEINIASSVFKNCSADYSGGAINIENGTADITSSTFTSCSASSGGAISISHDILSVTSSTFEYCSAAEDGGAIMTSSDTNTVTSSTFTGCSAEKGGAIEAEGFYNGIINVVSSTFTGCSAENGGAISNNRFTLNVTSSTFEDCSVPTTGEEYCLGGAIYTFIGTTHVTLSTFTNCSAYCGGAISSYSAFTTTITSSDFIDCPANQGGAIFAYSDTTNVTSSTFTNCSTDSDTRKTEPRGGAIYIQSHTAGVTSSTFTNCLAYNGKGGTIYIESGTTDITLSDFTNSGAFVGGAIFIENGTTGVTSSNFTNCEASSGGAVLANDATTVTSSTFTGCSAETGGAIDIGSSGSMHFSRIYNCSALGKAVNSRGIADSFDAKNNWWGTNTDPSAFIEETTTGSVTYDPWLVLGASASPATVNAGGNSVIRADLRYNSDGDDTSGSGYVPDGIPVTFGLAAGPGSLSPLSGVTGSGVSATTYSSSSIGTATINTIVDNQTVNCIVLVNSGGSRSGGGSNSNTGVGASENLKAGDTASFNFDGKGSVDGLLVTVGDNTAKLMVTVERRNSLPSSIDAPDTEVYEYEDVTIYYAEPSGISGGTFEFKVEKSWLSSKGFEIGDIVMMHYNEDTSEWGELSTTFVREEGGYYYYSAETPSFSWFAIVFSEGAAIVPEREATVAATAKATSFYSATPEPDETQAVTVPKDDNYLWSSMAFPGLGLILVGIILACIIIRKRREKYPDWWDKELK